MSKNFPPDFGVCLLTAEDRKNIIKEEYENQKKTEIKEKQIMLKQMDYKNVHLLPGLFKERSDVNRNYLAELKTQGLLQNFYLEAGVVMPGLQVLEKPEAAELHWGWEAPTCQLRGHFLGHWMSAAAMQTAVNHDRELEAKLETVVDELAKCQELNGGKWIGSVPEKYFRKLEKNESVWSPQYVLHKTLLGLLHTYVYTGNETALKILTNAADWYIEWTDEMKVKNPHAIYAGEAGGMLEVWAALYEATQEEKYLSLAERYSQPSLFTDLSEGKDALTNCHANASIPWAHGAAKMYEVTGEEKWLELTESFWNCAVNERESYCTGGQNAGEFWVPPHRNGQFLGDRNQEFCTVYNMVRLAEYLFRFTGDSVYGDYIEKNLYNGFLAQQNQCTGMPAYFLPLKAGSRKRWGSKTHDFWCCHGTMVQSQTVYPTLCWYEDTERNRLVVSQYIPSEVQWKGVTITQNIDMKYYNEQAFFDENDESQMSRWLIKFTVRAERASRFTISFRMPEWLAGDPGVSVNHKAVTDVVTESGYLNIEREWKQDEVSIYLPSAPALSALPDRPELSAVVDGPIVLAGLCDADCGLYLSGERADSALSVSSEHTYSTFPWKQSTYITVNQPKNFTLVPLYDITDEQYTVYFTKKTRPVGE